MPFGIGLSAHQPAGAHIHAFDAVQGALVFFGLVVDIVGVAVIDIGASVQTGAIGVFVPQVS